MSAFARHIETVSLASEAMAEIVQLMDEHHLVATGRAPDSRVRFGAGLGRFLAGMRDVEVCHLHGRYVTDLDSFCNQLEHALIGPPLVRRLNGRDGVVAMLRRRESIARCRPPRLRYFIWHDADVLLLEDRMLFSSLTDALVGVAAESEYVDDDLLLIQRLVLIGDEALDRYSRDPRGQCRSWLRDAAGIAKWRLTTGVRRPAFLRYNIDTGRVDH